MAEHFIEQIVDAEMLMTVTSQGWAVVERIEHDAPIQFTDNVVMPPNTWPQSITRSQIGRVTRYRVRRSADDLVAQLEEKLSKLEADAMTHATSARSHAEAFEKEQREHIRTKRNLDDQHAVSARLQKEREQSDQLRRQLEGDLAKVREHIGRKLFEEILPPARSKGA